MVKKLHTQSCTDFFSNKNKKFTISDLGNSIVFTGCQLSLSNCNRNLQTLGSLCMGTGNLHRAHKKGQVTLAQM